MGQWAATRLRYLSGDSVDRSVVVVVIYGSMFKMVPSLVFLLE